jgi:hypothetical protein
MQLRTLDKNLVGVVLIGVIITIYSFFQYDQYSENELIKVEGTLKEEPFYGSNGGDIQYDYIRFKLLEYKNRYYIKSYAYDALQMDSFKKLKPGDLLRLGVIEKESSQENVNIYELYSDKYGFLLKLENFNKYSRQGWKYVLFPTAFALFVLIFRLGNRMLIKNL